MVRVCKNTEFTIKISFFINPINTMVRVWKKNTNKEYLQKNLSTFFLQYFLMLVLIKDFQKKNTFQNALMNFKEKSRWKYCFIIVFPNANKTILKETKIYLLIKGHFQMKFNSLSFIKSNKLVVEILLIKWYTKCYVEWNLIW